MSRFLKALRHEFIEQNIITEDIAQGLGVTMPTAKKYMKGDVKWQYVADLAALLHAPHLVDVWIEEHCERPDDDVYVTLLEMLVRGGHERYEALNGQVDRTSIWRYLNKGMAPNDEAVMAITRVYGDNRLLDLYKQRAIENAIGPVGKMLAACRYEAMQTKQDAFSALGMSRYRYAQLEHGEDVWLTKEEVEKVVGLYGVLCLEVLNTAADAQRANHVLRHWLVACDESLEDIATAYEVDAARLVYAATYDALALSLDEMSQLDGLPDDALAKYRRLFESITYFGEALRVYRMQNGVALDDIAAKLGLAGSRSLRLIEQLHLGVSLERAQRIVDVLEDAQWLLGYERDVKSITSTSNNEFAEALSNYANNWQGTQRELWLASGAKTYKSFSDWKRGITIPSSLEYVQRLADVFHDDSLVEKWKRVKGLV